MWANERPSVECQPEIEEPEDNPLILAVEDENIQEVIATIKREPEYINAPSHDDQQTALHRAVQGGFFEAIKALVENGAEINQQDKGGKTPLFLAARENHTSVIKYLIDKGADRNIPNNIEEKPIEIAKYYEQHQAVALLKTYPPEDRA